MKDNTLRDDIDELVTEASRYDMRSTDYDNITDKILTLLAEEVRKVKIEELELILNGYGWGEGEEAANFIIKDRIAELEKDK